MELEIMPLNDGQVVETLRCGGADERREHNDDEESIRRTKDENGGRESRFQAEAGWAGLSCVERTKAQAVPISAR